VAPDRANIEEDGLVFFGRKVEGFCAPFVPVDWLVQSGPQVGRGRSVEGVSVI
jgi:hypothetical protein